MVLLGSSTDRNEATDNLAKTILYKQDFAKANFTEDSRNNFVALCKDKYMSACYMATTVVVNVQNLEHHYEIYNSQTPTDTKTMLMDTKRYKLKFKCFSFFNNYMPDYRNLKSMDLTSKAKYAGIKCGRISKHTWHAPKKWREFNETKNTQEPFKNGDGTEWNPRAFCGYARNLEDFGTKIMSRPSSAECPASMIVCMYDIINDDTTWTMMVNNPQPTRMKNCLFGTSFTIQTKIYHYWRVKAFKV